MNRELGFFKLGCFSLGGLAAAGVVLLIIIGVSLAWGGGLFSPGALNAQTGPQPLGGADSHAVITCAGCHPAPFSGQTMTSLCLACHTDLSQDPKNFHNVMIAQGKNGGCTQCHTDHHGPQAAQTRFDASGFPHNSVGFSLLAHQKMAGGSAFQCSDCHKTNFTRFDQAVCAACHFDINKAFLTDHLTTFGDACQACHDGLDSYGHSFNHSGVPFALSGKHAALTCGQCHAMAVNLAALKSAPTACAACHTRDDAHKGTFGQDCAQCHTPDGWQTEKVDHSKTAFPLTGKHQAVNCSDCHQNAVFKGTPSACAACHAKDDTHKGSLGQDCAQCHTAASWQDAKIDHSKTAFPLVGKHLTTACTACHLNQVFKGTPSACFACHAKDDTHKGGFGQDCAQCHTAVSWQDASIDHNKTAFPLTGKHASVVCTACHINQVFKGTPTACVGCHADPAFHQGLFGSDCVSCHTTSGWQPAKFNSPHGFPINHGGSGSCASCHPSSLLTYTCYICHDQAQMANRHRGVSAADLPNCARCHASGGGGG